MVKRMEDAVLVSHSWDEKIRSKNSVEKELARYTCCMREEASEDGPRITGMSDTDKGVVNVDSMCAAGAAGGFREKSVRPFQFTWISSSGDRLL